MIHYQRFYISLIIAVLALSLLGRGTVSAQDAPNTTWSDPKLLFEDRSGFSRLDYMTPDASGAVHIFWSANPRSPYTDGNEFDENETVINYQSLVQGVWSSAHDILLRSQVRMPFGAGIDSQGTLHIMTVAGGPPCLAYLSVASRQADNPRAWPQPICLDSVGVGSPDLAIDGNDGLYAIYATRSQKEIAVISSLDGGRSWSSSVPVASIADNDVNLGFPRMVVDAKGRLHAIWGEVQAPGGYPFIRLMYARSLDGGLTWSDSIELADEHQGDPNLAVFGDSVHAVWNGDAGYQGRYYRVSNDGGVTWSERITLPLPVTSGGLQGASAIIVDGTGTVHILYTDSQRLYYITQQDGVWSQAIQIAGPENTGSIREINFPMLAITEGNQLHALYTRDAQVVYYQQRLIDAPYQPSTLLPEMATPMPAATNTPTPVREKPTPAPTTAAMEATPSSSLSGSYTILFAVLPALVLVAGILLIQISRRRR